MIPSKARAEVDMEDERILDVKCEVPTEKPVKFITPDRFVTSENFKNADLTQSAVEPGGVLAVGEKAVSRLMKAVPNKKARNIAASIIEIAQAG